MIQFNKDIFLRATETYNPDLLENSFPWGSIRDHTDGIAFGRSMCTYLNWSGFTVLDLGSSTGTVPLSLRQMGIDAVGLEGSIWPGRFKLGAWGKKGVVELCNLEEPWEIVDGNDSAFLFDVICAWEVIEHIAEDKLDNFFRSVLQHCKPQTPFVVTINDTPSPVTCEEVLSPAALQGVELMMGDTEGVELHKTLKPISWWRELLETYFTVGSIPPGVKVCRPESPFHVWLTRKKKQ